MKDLYDELTETQQKKINKQKKSAPSLGQLMIGPRKIPPGAVYMTASEIEKRKKILLQEKEKKPETELEKLVLEQSEEMKLTSTNEIGTRPSKQPRLKKLKEIGESKKKMIQTDLTNSEPLKREERTADIQTLITNETPPEKRKEIQLMDSTRRYSSSSEVISEVVNSLNVSEKHLLDCIESQMRDLPDRSVKLMDPHRAHTVIEASKGILVAMKLKLDAAKMINEQENK
jgi:hypothetical protein